MRLSTSSIALNPAKLVRSMRSREAFCVLAIGCVLSVVMVIPSVLYSARFGGGNPMFHVIFNLILLVAVASPFLTLYFFTRKRGREIATMTFGVVFSLCHAWMIFTSYAFKPQEFGYLGLVFAPFLEAFIGVPIALVLVLVVKRLNRR